jgi:aminopeptidase N
MKRHAIGALAAISVLIASCAPAGPDVVDGVSLELGQHRAAILSNIHYVLSFDIPGDVDGDIAGTAAVRFDLADAAVPLQLDFREAADHLHSVTVNGADTDWSFLNEHVVIPSGALARGANEIEIRFTAGSSSLNRNPEYLYTLFVPDRARTAFPLFDQPDLKATYELKLRVPPGWTAMGNAPVSRVHYGREATEYRFAESDLIPSYLFSFVAGQFQRLTQRVGDRTMTMLHRETDMEKVERNVDEIFRLHASALDWLEDYTGIDYPFGKFGFALIPAFQYGGMEHVGAIQYRASSLFLDEAPSQTQLLGRAGLIAHETAHMWFGDLVTMEWFNDVWTKEVFANFMAAKIVNPNFPDVDHDLNFLVRHYPRAYSVDRTPGANPIRQHLPNLNEAGQMYGAIIYNKAPIMMRQLERMIGEDAFRAGLREYLSTFAFSNATWPALIEILDRKTGQDLVAWSEVWVNTPGRPGFVLAEDTASFELQQVDPAGSGRVWPQKFAITTRTSSESVTHDIDSHAEPVRVELPGSMSESILNSDGYGYGLFPGPPGLPDAWGRLGDVEKGSVLVNAFENLVEGRGPSAAGYPDLLASVVRTEDNQLLLDLALGQLQRVYWSFLTDDERLATAPQMEAMLWEVLQQHEDPGIRKMVFMAYASIATGNDHLERIYQTWSGDIAVDNLPLSENDRIDLAQQLAVKFPDRAETIMALQIEETENPDNVRKLEFIAPSVSADAAARDAFFLSLADESRRETESWVLDALANLHHPLRTAESERYILPSLDLLEEIQVTGDIFFPKRWLDETLANHRSDTAVATVRRFLDERPDYNEQLRMKIQQSANMMQRANALTRASDRP